jgi:hypothetical protein
MATSDATRIYTPLTDVTREFAEHPPPGGVAEGAEDGVQPVRL